MSVLWESAVWARHNVPNRKAVAAGRMIRIVIATSSVERSSQHNALSWSGNPVCSHRHRLKNIATLGLAEPLRHWQNYQLSGLACLVKYVDAMTSRYLYVCLHILLCSLPLIARENSDVIIMKNGDRFTGEIKEISSGVVYVSLDYVDGTISIQWSKVAKLESRQQFIVKSQDGSVHSGTLNTIDKSSPQQVGTEIEITDNANNKVVLERSTIVRVDQTSEKVFRRFNGAINVGSTYSKGNQSAQYNLGAETAYLEERWQADAAFNSNLSTSSGTNASSRNQLNVNALRLLPWRNYFYFGKGSFLQSSEQEIRLQSNLGVGIGRFLKNTNRTRVSIIGGLAWQSTDYKQSLVPVSRQNIAAALIGANISVFRFKRTNLDVTATMVPGISDPGRIFFDTNATYYVKLFKNFSWNASFYGNWDTQPPGKLPGSDYGSTSGISWTFGNR